MFDYTEYFTEDHLLYRKQCRDFIQKEIVPYVDEWEEKNEFPKDIYRKAGEKGLLGASFPQKYGGRGGDDFMYIIMTEEMIKSGSGGIATSMGSLEYTLPLIIDLAEPGFAEKAAKEILSGEKITALGITESGVGSDFINLQTTAVLEDGCYRVNGSKMFITSGARADYLVTAVRTGGPGFKGISLLLIEKDTPGFTVKRSIKKTGWWAGDTAELEFKDCMVPAKNLLGVENRGFYPILRNFQKERLMLAVMATETAQMALDECIRYSKERTINDRPMSKLQVITQKIAEMATNIAASREFNYRVAKQLALKQSMDMEISMAKNFATKICDQATYDAVQIFGGKGYIRDFIVERLARDSRVLSIGGGTYEIMNEIIAKRVGL